jgi:hypothetical protein
MWKPFLLLAFIWVASCSRGGSGGATDAGAAPPAASAEHMESCTSHDKLAAAPCRTGSRKLDSLPESAGLVLSLSHCPLDDCGSGGCSYEVYGQYHGCLRRLGEVRGASIDITAPDAAAPSIRTWGRSGTTHVATDYELQEGRLVPRGRLVCDYGSAAPLPAACPKL